EEASGRSKLRTWLKQNKIKVPKSPRFDFNAYLDGEAATAKTVPSARTSSFTASVVSGLTPLLHEIVCLVGRRADDPAVVDFFSNKLGKSVPTSTTDASDTKYVEAKKQGIEACFQHRLINEKHPPVNKTKTAFVPYLSTIWLKENFSEPLPFG